MSDEAVVAQQAPYEVELKEGRSYAWCSCGRSAKQPFCDGSHKVTSLTPIVFKAARSETVFLCGCKATGDQPYCDGTHNSL